MLVYCPICNILLKERGEQIIAGITHVECFDCGSFDIELDLSEIMRRKYLCFNRDSAGGKEAYEENLKTFRDYIRFHHHPILTQAVINEMRTLRRP